MNGLASLDLFDFGILLQALSNNLKVGVLAVRSDGREKFLRLDRSRLTAVYVKKPKASVEKVLWNYRSIEKAGVRAAVEAIERDPSAGPLPRYLVERGVVSQQDMRRAQLYQVIEEVLEVFYWKNVGFEFYAGDAKRVSNDPTLVAISEPIDVDSLLLQCTKTIDDVAKFNEVTPSMRDVYEFHPGSVGALEDAVPDPVEREFLLLVDGLRDMREVLRDMRLNRFDALEFFYRFRMRGWLRPKNAFELLMLAENRRKDFSLEKRARVLERVNELGCEGFQVLVPLAETYEEMGAKDKAAALYARHAKRCLDADDSAAAVKAACRAASLLPTEIELREFEIEVLALAGRTVESGVAQMRLAELRIARGDLAGARRGLHRAVRIAPKDPAPWQLLGEVYERSGLRRRGAACRARAAAALRERGATGDAVETYRRAIELCEGAWRIRYDLAALLADTGRGDAAVQVLAELVAFVAERAAWSAEVRIDHLLRVEERLRASGGLASSAATQLGQAFASLGQTDRAVGVFRASAEILARAGRHRSAVSVLESLLEVAPNDYDGRRALARAHVASGDGTRALAQLRRLASHFMASERYADAKEVYAEMLGVDPACPDAHRGIARTLLYLGETDLAAEHYHRVGLIYRGYGRHEEAIPYLREAVEGRPNDAELLEEYCELLSHTDQRTETLRALSALVELRMAQGSPGRAAIALTRILEIDSHYPGARAILQEAARQLLRLAETSEELAPVDPRKLVAEARSESL